MNNCTIDTTNEFMTAKFTGLIFTRPTEIELNGSLWSININSFFYLAKI